MKLQYVDRDNKDIVSVLLPDGWHSVRSFGYLYRWRWSRSAIRFLFFEGNRVIEGPASSVLATWVVPSRPDPTAWQRFKRRVGR